MKTRREFIEADYVNGTYNDKGELVIRALDEYETEWLSQFYAETEHGNFAKTKEIGHQEKHYKELCRKLRNNKKFMSSEDVLELKQECEEAYNKLVHLRAETNTFYPEDADRHEIFNRDYTRREDVFNRAKSANALISFDVPEYDQFTSRAESDINPEHLVLDYLTKRPVKKIVKKRKKP